MADRPFTDADREVVRRVIADVRYDDGSDRQADAVLATLAAAGRLLPEPTETRVEWGVWWHAGNPDGICLDSCHLTSEDEARLVGTGRLGELGIDSYTVVRREHRCYPDGWFVPHWTRHSGPHTKGEVDG